jgi:hypothetical protein
MIPPKEQVGGPDRRRLSLDFLVEGEIERAKTLKLDRVDARIAVSPSVDSG